MALNTAEELIIRLESRQRESEIDRKECADQRSRFSINDDYEIKTDRIEPLIENLVLSSPAYAIIINGKVIKDTDQLLSSADGLESITVELLGNEIAEDNDAVQEASNCLLRLDMNRFTS
ncbi:MAG: hypothetical protein HOE83_03700 [Alphaproteobacteria bacterium]|jgi:hypothetical protein|nr:hypothetical protein [Alphaproteobacteria bacterium]MBT4082864.1 hypothetical protein [Alphaproteobacteria bacterium]MBT4889379.1 hypothetical protein [Rhodospirillales bacterium]